MSRKRIKLRIIPKPAEGTRTIFVKGEDSTKEKRLKPYFKGSGDTDYVCSMCGHVLVEAMNVGQLSNLVFKCPKHKCGKYNELL